MKPVRLATTLLALTTVGSFGAVQAADPPGDINIAVVQSMFRETPPALAKALSRPLTAIITRRTGLTGGELEIAPDALALADRLKAGKCQLGVFHGFEFAWARKHNPNLVPLVVTVYPTGCPRACVIVNATNQAKELSDLKGVPIAVPKGSRGHCYLYLDGQNAIVPSETDPPATAEVALHAVVNGTSPAAVVDEAAYVGFEKLHPGAFKRLRVLAKSVEFPQNVIAYHKGSLSEASAVKLRGALTDAHTTAAGKPLMMLWNIVKFDEVPEDYSVQLDRISKLYPTPVKVGGSAGTGGR